MGELMKWTVVGGTRKKWEEAGARWKAEEGTTTFKSNVGMALDGAADAV